MPDRDRTLSDIRQEVKEDSEQFNDYVWNTPIPELITDIAFVIFVVFLVVFLVWIYRDFREWEARRARNKQPKKVESTISYRFGTRVRRLFARDGK